MLEANLSKLPRMCYTVSESGDLVQLHRNQKGYYLSALSSLEEEKNRALADQLNAGLCVTKAQEQAMLVGSLFGFHVPGADPDRYTEQGIPKRDLEMPAFADEERAYTLNGGEYYLHIQTSEEGYDYTFYRRDFSEYDGGQLDEPNMSMDQAAQTILGSFNMQDLPRETYDIDQLLSRADEVAAARLDAAYKAHGIRPVDMQIADAQKRSEQQTAQQSREAMGKEPERS